MFNCNKLGQIIYLSNLFQFDTGNREGKISNFTIKVTTKPFSDDSIISTVLFL